MTYQEYIDREEKFGAQIYKSVPVVLSKGRGAYVWDVAGKKYLDFLASYSAVNQGHCHPAIIKAAKKQINRLNITSKAFYNDAYGEYAEYITSLFRYDRVLPMNSGAEAVETAIKLCRKWGYEKKKIRADKVKIIVCENNFHGRTTTIVSFSTDPDTGGNYGPVTPGFEIIPHNDLNALEFALRDPNVSGFLVEPIQGEAGIYVPDEGYLEKAYRLCREKNVLFVADEIQTGLGRTGSMLACGHENIKPDVLLLGKALSGGLYPVSAVLANEPVMQVFRHGQHGSTFGGNPMASRIAMAALKVIVDEKLPEKAAINGEAFREKLREIKSDKVAQVRGRGLMNAIEINDGSKLTAWDICMKMKDMGLLAKPTHGKNIRLTPPLVITEKELTKAAKIIRKALK